MSTLVKQPENRTNIVTSIIARYSLLSYNNNKTEGIVRPGSFSFDERVINALEEAFEAGRNFGKRSIGNESN